MSKETELSAMAEQIVQDIIIVDDISKMRAELREMWDIYVTQWDATDAEKRSSVYMTYKTLYDALYAIDAYNELKFATPPEE